MRVTPMEPLTLALIDGEGGVNAFEAFDVSISADSGYGTTGIEASITKRCGWADAGSSTGDKLSVLGLTDGSTGDVFTDLERWYEAGEIGMIRPGDTIIRRHAGDYHTVIRPALERPRHTEGVERIVERGKTPRQKIAEVIGDKTLVPSRDLADRIADALELA